MDFYKGHFVNGAYNTVKTSEPQYVITNPANRNDRIATIDVGSSSNIREAARCAREAFDTGPWPRMNVSERTDILLNFARLIEKHRKRLGMIESMNVGKLLHECMHHEVKRAATNIRFFAEYVRDDMEKALVFEKDARFLRKDIKLKSAVGHYPVGVVGIITPWNSPLLLGTFDLGPALACGNTCVLKPPIWAPLSLLYLGELANEAGIPKGVLNIVPGGAFAGRTLVLSEEVDRISFTGSVDAGLDVNRLNASTRLAPALLELGGKAANIVWEDCDFDFTVEGVMKSIFRSQGQSCVAGSRLLLHRNIADSFLDALIARTKNLKIGYQINEDTDIGPLITEKHVENVMHFIRTGKEEGAQCVWGGRRLNQGPYQFGNFVEPTIFTDVTPDMTIFRKEIFGPVLSVTEFEDEKEAIKLANATQFGLSSNIWTEDAERADRIADRLNVGMVWRNCHFVRDLNAPFGGWKQSGAGPKGGRWSIQFYTQTKMIARY